MSLVPIIFFFLESGFAQEKIVDKISGSVTYKSSQNIYIKFENTAGISAGDTLFIELKKDLKPAVIVKFISSRSIAGKLINGKELKLNDLVYAYVERDVEELHTVKDTIAFKTDTLSFAAPEEFAIRDKKEFTKKKKSFAGRISAQSYSNISNSGNRDDFQRWRYSLSLSAEDISGSNFSFSNYTTFSYRASEWGNVASNLGRSLKVYDLSLSYKFNPTAVLWFGRHINRKVSNISSIDGLQFEKLFGNFYTGLIAGSRPNFIDLGYNVKLFELGGYVGRTDSTTNGTMENTLGVFQQTNDFKTDRRFFYFQHSNNILSKTSFFFSTEVDLFKKEKGVNKNNFSLTSLFLSARYSPAKVISFSLSYDARKNVIYYETFKNFIDSLIENETRQGFRGGINIHPFNNFFIGFNGGYRFQKSDLKPSRNFSGYISYSNLPLIEASSTLSFNKIISSFVDGNIWGARLSKDLSFNSSSISLSYRRTDYGFANSTEKSKQNSITIDLSGKLIQEIFLSLSYEGTFEGNRSFGRILIDLSAHL